MESLQILGQELKTLRGALFTTKLQLREAEKEAKMMREKAEEARSAIDLSLSIFCLIEQLLPQSGFKTLGSTNVVKTVSNSLVHTFRQKRRLFRYFHTHTKYLRSFHKIFDIFIIPEQKNLVQRNNLELCRKLCFCCPDKLVGRL